MDAFAARRTEDRVARVAAAAHAPVPLLRAAVDALRPRLPTDAWCGMTLDPVTVLPTGGDHRDGLPMSTLPLLLDLEYRQGDVAGFEALSRLRTGVSTLAAATGGRPERSARYREILAPAGLPHELRIALRAGGRCWGALVLFRAEDVPGFGAAEVALAARLGDALGAGIRRGLVLDAATRADGEAGPAVMVLRLAPELAVETAAPALPLWSSLVPDDGDRSGVPVTVLSACAGVTAVGGRCTPPSSTPRRRASSSSSRRAARTGS